MESTLAKKSIANSQIPLSRGGGEGVQPVIIPLCQGLRADRQRCGSPALRGGTLCYAHNRQATGASIRGDHPIFVFPDLTSRRGLRRAARNLIRAAYDQRHSPKELSFMLYTLQVAQGIQNQIEGQDKRTRRSLHKKQKALL